MGRIPIIIGTVPIMMGNISTIIGTAPINNGDNSYVGIRKNFIELWEPFT